MGNLFSQIEGRGHGSFMLATSGFLQDLQRFSNCPATGDPLCVSGDPAYPIRAHLRRPYKGGVLTPARQDFITSISTVCSSVEWIFGDIVNYFKFVDFKKNPKTGLSALGKNVCNMYVNAKCTKHFIWFCSLRVFWSQPAHPRGILHLILPS